MKQTNLAKNTALLSIGTILTKGINLIMIPLFSAWLSTEDYGVYDLLATYVSLLIPFVTLSSSDAVFRFVIDSNNEDDKKKYISTTLGVVLFNSLIVIAAFTVINYAAGWSYAFPFIILLLSELLLNHLQGVARATRKLKVYALTNVISTLGIAMFVTLFVLVLQMGLVGMIYGYAFGYFLGEAVLVVSIRYWKFIKFRSIDLAAFKELIGYSYPLIPNNICWWLVNVSDRTVINIFLGDAANGIYAIACKIPNVCASVFSVFNISWQEAAIDVLDSEERNIYYNKIYNSTIAIMISLCGGILSLNYFLFEFIFDQRYFEAAYYTPILITSIIFSALTQYFGGIQISFKRPKENGITTMIGATVNVIIDLFFISSIGVYAAAISTLAANMVICIIRYVRLRNDVKFKIEKRNFAYIAYYLYICVSSYNFNYMIWSFLNFCLACLMFCIINKQFINGFIRKLGRRIHP